MEERTDKERIDWLEWMAKKPEAILLHAQEKTGRLGLGLANPDRSLRQAVDEAMEHDRNWRTRS